MKAIGKAPKFGTTSLCVGLMLLVGCAHPLSIENIGSYQSFGKPSPDGSMKIGLTTDATDSEQRRLLDGVALYLGGSRTLAVKLYSDESEMNVDIIASFDIKTEYKGSGWNFLINWPGFLIFTPAWHGYIYKVNHSIHCTLTETASNEVIDEFSMPIALDVRHADINRTWTQISLTFFDLTLSAFLGGLYFINYDESVTPLVGKEIENPLGKFIAQEIASRIDSSDMRRSGEQDRPL